MKRAQHLCDFSAFFSFQFRRHQGRRRLTNRATVAGEFDVLQSTIAVELYREMNLVTACRIIAVHSNSRVWQLAKISRPPRMIEDYLLIEFFEIAEFRVHLKKRTAFSRISIMRSISSRLL